VPAGGSRSGLAAGPFRRPVPLLDRPEVPREELVSCETLVFETFSFDVYEESFEFVSWLVTQFSIALFTEVLEVLAVSVPAVTLFVVLACF
jgi:hypothetical protein